MNSITDRTADPLLRALDALARLEKAEPDVLVRRTAAEPMATPAETAISGSDDAGLHAENDRLRSENATLRQEAGRLAAQVERALEQLNLIEKG